MSADSLHLPAVQEAEADDRMKTALDEIEAHLHRSGSPHPAIMQEFFSEYGVEKLKVCWRRLYEKHRIWVARLCFLFMPPNVFVETMRTMITS